MKELEPTTPPATPKGRPPNPNSLCGLIGQAQEIVESGVYAHGVRLTVNQKAEIRAELESLLAKAAQKAGRNKKGGA